ncbi:hypothetical protein OESDEN_24689 [Oesophagostomum dentatum]|uniref:Uncharacterized protein n=1 Tax=Oesophagostomum dentatum TaxID=61180 RepID=A0A0B1RXG7_OESDE|nr:hypothetical protein OESDEN_24689 [Oesophagostomum dentatum]
MDLVYAVSSTPEVIVVKAEHHSDSDEKLFEEATSLLDKEFTIRGDRLLSLFRFCPNCGSKISSEKGSLVLLEDNSSPVVHYYCDSCPGKQCWYGV